LIVERSVGKAPVFLMSAVALSSLFRVPEVPEPAAFDAEP